MSPQTCRIFTPNERPDHGCKNGRVNLLRNRWANSFIASAFVAYCSSSLGPSPPGSPPPNTWRASPHPHSLNIFLLQSSHPSLFHPWLAFFPFVSSSAIILLHLRTYQKISSSTPPLQRSRPTVTGRDHRTDHTTPQSSPAPTSGPCQDFSRTNSLLDAIPGSIQPSRPTHPTDLVPCSAGLVATARPATPSSPHTTKEHMNRRFPVDLHWRFSRLHPHTASSFP